MMTNLPGKSNSLLNLSMRHFNKTDLTDYMSVPHVTYVKLKVMGGGTGLNQLWGGGDRM